MVSTQIDQQWCLNRGFENLSDSNMSFQTKEWHCIFIFGEDNVVCLWVYNDNPIFTKIYSYRNTEISENDLVNLFNRANITYPFN